MTGGGRTAAGAHAMGQCVSFHCQRLLPCSEILSQLWMHLPEDMGVLSCEEVPPRFHARLNATAKTYEYRVWNSSAPCVFQRKYCYRLPVPLGLTRCGRRHLLVGQHDFRSFCFNKKMKKSTVRTIYSLELTASGPDLRFVVRGDGFCTTWSGSWWVPFWKWAWDAGNQRKSPAFWKLGIGKAAGYTVPAHGLFLMEVEYP